MIAGRSRSVFAMAVFVMVQLGGVGEGKPATISGQIQNEVNGGLGGSEVDLYRVDSKGARFQSTVATDGSGNYVFSGLSVGTYRVFARPSGASNRLRRWYDVVAPFSGGQRGVDADDLPLTVAGSTLTGINTTSFTGGGVDGHTRSGVVYLPNIVVRLQDRSDPLAFLDAVTQVSPDAGSYSHRGALSGQYLFIAYDPSGQCQTTIFPGPYIVVASSSQALGDFSLQQHPPDPYEPNDSIADAPIIDASVLHLVPPQSYVTAGAVITVRGSDPDWYCFSAVAGDHLLISTSSTITVLGTVYEHPWLDPILSWWTDDGVVMNVSADDTATSRHPQLEVWVENSGTHCAVVSTYGDTTWTGAGQESAGAYQLRIEQLNRKPLVSVNDASVAEGEMLLASFTFEDLELDPLTATATLTDVHGVEVPSASFEIGASGGSLTWTPSNTASADGPYVLTVIVSDGTYETIGEATITVTAVNLPPPVPILVAPLDGAALDTMEPSLVLLGTADPDGDGYAFEVELRYGASDAAVAQSAWLAAVVGAELAWTAVEIPEDTTVYWRARSDDGYTQSEWSAMHSFLVDTMTVPIISDPSEPSPSRKHGCNAGGADSGLLIVAGLVLETVRRRLSAKAVLSYLFSSHGPSRRIVGKQPKDSCALRSTETAARAAVSSPLKDARDACS